MTRPILKRMVDGIEIELSRDESDALYAEWDQYDLEVKEREEKFSHIDKRISEYPYIGDQLDALIKQFEYMRDYNKLFLVPDMTKILNQVTNVKMKYPKEGA